MTSNDMFWQEWETLLPMIEDWMRSRDYLEDMEGREEMNGSNQDAINEIALALVKRLNALEEECKQLHKRVLSLEFQLEHQIPRINDIEDKIDWSKKGKI